MKRIAQFALIIIFSFFTTILAGTVMAEDQTTLYDKLLHQYVKDGQVDYTGFKEKEADLDTYLEYLAVTDPEKMSEKERFAFYINTYNAYTIKLILKNFEDGKPPASIKDIGSFFSKPWSIKFVKVGGRTKTLDNIEHDILRPTFKDARVHFAVNCASKSCPPLISTPYSGTTLELQLDASTIAFINNRQENRLEGSILYISSIFKWFKEDFQNDPISFFEKYAEGDLKKELAAQKGRIKVKYLDYDWSLNGK
ncbi:MAG: DUF547 domain-containing protein [Thermodesulfobacteriota bacterium]|nr:DUF547 domain-containing protein [Thermodesulfobacteriota bacterium]